MIRILLQLLALYRYWLSPAMHSLMPTGCRYQPTCSQYASEAIQTHGAAPGCWLALKRVLRCHPFARSGFDPVPLDLKSTQQSPQSPESTGSEPPILTHYHREGRLR